MAKRDIERADLPPGAEEAADDFSAIPKPSPVPFCGPKRSVFADEPGLGYTNTGQAGEDPQMTSQAEAARMGQPLAVAEQKVRR